MNDTITVREKRKDEKTVYELRLNKKAIGAARADTSKEQVVLESIFIKEEKRNKGYGSILLGFIEEANWYKDSIILTVNILSSDYGKLLHFYEKNGYFSFGMINMKKNLKKGIDKKNT